MKVVHINATGKLGGAGIAAYRHCDAMRRAGYEASLLVLYKNNCVSPFIFSLLKKDELGRLKNLISNHIMGLFLRLFHSSGVFNFPLLSTSVASHPLVKEADLIYIHWVAGSMMSDKEIERILKLGKPVRWYMHDMNPITGGCHYSMDCDKYKTGCKECPYLQCRFGIDLSKIQFNRRIEYWSKYTNLEAYTPSQWLGDLVKQSLIWRGHKVTVFPNVFDLNLFHPRDKHVVREILGVDSNKKIVLFGSAGIDVAYKGWNYLKEALNMLDPNKYEALIFGPSNRDLNQEIHIPYKFTGQLFDEYSLVLLYNASDVFVSSSLADNYPNVIMESMACGLPCVGFKVGGLKDQIQHKINGYLAEYKNSKDLAVGIQFICESSEDDYISMQKNARSFVTKVASYDVYRNPAVMSVDRESILE
jgi:glycosyltransferase involved in cell wall biosynthesis